MMRRYINLLEGVEDVPLADIGEGDHEDFNFFSELDNIMQRFATKLRDRRHVEDVYMLVLDGIPFEDAVGHIARRAGIEPLDLRAACVDDYKVLRGRGETYDTPVGHALVSMLNPVIREAIEVSLGDSERD